MSASECFLLEDSSSSDESKIEDMILDDDVVEQTMVLVAVKELVDRMARKLGLPLFGVRLVFGTTKVSLTS
jgi:hypothetical protein